MKNIKVLILRTAGTNCDQETRIAFELVGAKVKSLHVNDLVIGKNKIFDYQIIAFPGGFTYGDDIAAGKILANELKMKLKTELQKFLAKNGLMIGICNGFQVLVKMGILPGNDDWQQESTLACNDSGKFEDRWVYLKKTETREQKIENRGESKCVWTRGIDKVIYLPVAHGEGKFITLNKSVLNRLKDNGQIVYQYCDKNGEFAAYPDNPNGSFEHIAGICDDTGRIFGLMPHPERCVFRTQHPRWTREEDSQVPDGLNIFKNAVDYLKKA
ncbi:MAG: phosphoribosylformylglycinamidine synthase I [Candidatus Omnitrophica bacterium]|nr:phosphoribosylformylglycinamidine synthase I [Candidatus Omnitrophota bacterium]